VIENRIGREIVVKKFIILLSLFVLALPLNVFAEESTNDEVATNVYSDTFDVSNGFEQEVQLDQYTQLDWTLDNETGTYLLNMDLPGKQLPAPGWKEFYENKGWDISQPNELEIEFSDGTTGTMYADVIGNSVKVRFWMKAVTETIKTEEEKSFNVHIPKVNERATSKQVELAFEWINDTIVDGKWYIWLNYSEEPITTTEMKYTLDKLPPGQYHIKVEFREDDGNIVSEYEDTFLVSTDDGGILPNTATPWPNVILMGLILFLIGLFGRVFTRV
jgi:hypothetical protein